jgi:hypothetical protein
MHAFTARGVNHPEAGFMYTKIGHSAQPDWARAGVTENSNKLRIRAVHYDYRHPGGEVRIHERSVTEVDAGPVFPCHPSSARSRPHTPSTPRAALRTVVAPARWASRKAPPFSATGEGDVANASMLRGE